MTEIVTLTLKPWHSAMLEGLVASREVAAVGVSSLHGFGSESSASRVGFCCPRRYGGSDRSLLAVGGLRTASCRGSVTPLVVKALVDSTRCGAQGPRSGSSLPSKYANFEATESSWERVARTSILFLASSAFLLVAGLNACRPAAAQAVAATVTATATESTTESTTETETSSSENEPKPLSQEEENEMLDELTRLHEQMEKRNMPAAIELLDKLIEKNPWQLEFRFIRGHAYEYVGDLEKARKEFEDVLEREPLSLRGLQGLALVVKKEGKDISFIEKIVEDAATKASQESKSRDARNFRMLLGQLLTLKEDLPGALKHYEELSKEDPSDFRPYLCQGLVSCILGDLDTAEKHFSNFERQCPKHLESRYFLDELIIKAKAEAARSLAQQKKGSK